MTINNKTKRNFKYLSSFTAAFILSGVMFASCGSKKTKDASDYSTTPVPTVSEVPAEQKDSKVTSTPVPTVEVVKEEQKKYSSLNIDDNDSIEETVEKSYEEFKEFYEHNGMTKDQIRDMIFVINGKYTDEDAKPIIDATRLNEAYNNIERIMFSQDLIQKIDNINHIEDGIELENDFELSLEPSLVSLIDVNKAGGELTAKKLSEYEAVRDAEIDLIRKKGTYDKELINNLVIKFLVTDINNNEGNLNIATKDGQKFVIAAVNNYALQFSAITNNDTEYLEFDKDGVQKIKINPTVEERELENTVLRLNREGLLSEEILNSIIVYAKTKKEAGLDVSDESIAAIYNIDLEYTDLIIDYADFLTRMSNTMYFDIMCARRASSTESVNEVINNYSKNVYTLRSNQ